MRNCCSPRIYVLAFVNGHPVEWYKLEYTVAVLECYFCVKAQLMKIHGVSAKWTVWLTCILCQWNVVNLVSENSNRLRTWHRVEIFIAIERHILNSAIARWQFVTWIKYKIGDVKTQTHVKWTADVLNYYTKGECKKTFIQKYAAGDCLQRT